MRYRMYFCLLVVHSNLQGFCCFEYDIFVRCYCDRLTRSRVPSGTLWLVNALERAEAVDAYLASVDESVLDGLEDRSHTEVAIRNRELDVLFCHDLFKGLGDSCFRYIR